MKTHVIVVPYDSGARNVRMGQGPHALLRAGLVDLLERDGCAVSLVEVATADAPLPAEIATSFAVQREVQNAVVHALEQGAFPLVLSGNCNTAVGTVSALTSHGAPPVVCWFDAHADFNTPESSTSGFLDGMAVSMLTGDCWVPLTSQVHGFQRVLPRSVLLFGTRDVDPSEHSRMHERGIRHHDPASVIAGEYVSALEAFRGRSVYLHLDLDALDPREGRANAYAAPNGLSERALNAVITDIASRCQVRAMAMTAYDPDVDQQGRVAAVAGRLAAALLRACRGHQGTVA